MLWLLVACQGEIVVTGRVYEDLDAFGFPLAGGTIRLVDDAGEQIDEATTGPRGGFKLHSKPSVPLLAEVEAPDFARTSFTGVAGSETMRVADGQLYAVELRKVEAWRTLFAGCPGVGEPGAMVYGDVRLYNVTDEDGVSPTVGLAWAAIEAADGTRFEACYLNELGDAWDPEATRTGATGRFAIFGVPSGLHTLEVGADATSELSYTTLWTTWVPAGDDAVVPRFPVYIELPS